MLLRKARRLHQRKMRGASSSLLVNVRRALRLEFLVVDSCLSARWLRQRASLGRQRGQVRPLSRGRDFVWDGQIDFQPNHWNWYVVVFFVPLFSSLYRSVQARVCPLKPCVDLQTARGRIRYEKAAQTPSSSVRSSYDLVSTSESLLLHTVDVLLQLSSIASVPPCGVVMICQFSSSVASPFVHSRVFSFQISVHHSSPHSLELSGFPSNFGIISRRRIRGDCRNPERCQAYSSWRSHGNSKLLGSSFVQRGVHSEW